MASSLFSPLKPPIPSHRWQAALHVIAGAFGTVELEFFERIEKGASGAGIYRVIVEGAAYLLRVEASLYGLRDAARHYTCLRVAADAGISPRLVFADVKHAVAITEFVETTSLHPSETRETSLQSIVEALKKLHSAPLFPESIDYLDVVTTLMDRCQAAEILPKRMLEPIRGFFGEIAVAYPRAKLDLVSSHNDLHPGNLLLEGKRAWLVDWEAAFAADCFVDLAAVANFFLENESERDSLLQTYFGADIREAHRARLFLMRQVNRLFYAFTALNFVAVARPHARLTERGLREMTFDVGGGMDTVAGCEDRLCLACTLLKDALQDLDSPRFAEAVAILSIANLSLLSRAE